MASDTIPFIGRKNKLAQLNHLLQKRTASLVAIKGRRRIGKSRLIAEFTAGKKVVKFTGLPPENMITAQMQRDTFAKTLSNHFQIPGLRGDDWADLFTVLSAQVKEGPVIVVFDELSWMGTKDPTFLGKLKTVWDEQFKQNPKLILILCSSVSPWMEKHVISSTGYFGRISMKISLDELSIQESSQLIDAMGFQGSAYEKLLLLSVTGGIPWYIELIQPGLSAVENISMLCFSAEGILVDEFDAIFHDLFEKRGPICKKIVELLGKRARSFSEIAKDTGYSSGGQLSEYLHALVSSGFIQQDASWSLKSGQLSRFSQYRLKDNYLRFYLKYIRPQYQKIKSGKYESIAITSLPAFSTIMGLQFENLVLSNRKLIWEKLGIRAEDIVCDNPFFQKANKQQSACQVDYMIQTRLGSLYVCEIKFSSREIKQEVVSAVQQKIDRLQLPKNLKCIPVLIYVGTLSDALIEQDYFFQHIDFCDFLD